MNERITTAGIVIKGHLILVAQRQTEGSVNNGLWEFPGGKNRYGESEEDTLRREFLEELGVGIRVSDFLTSVDFVNNGTLYHLKAYRVELESEDFRLCVHSQVKYLSVEDISRLPLVDSDRKILEFLKNSGL